MLKSGEEGTDFSCDIVRMSEGREESPSQIFAPSSNILSYFNLLLSPTKKVFAESWSTSIEIIEIIDHPVDFELVDPPPKFSYHSRFTPFPVVGKGRSGRLSNSSRLTSLLRLFARQVSVCFHEFDNRIVRLCNSSIRYVSPLYPNGCYRERNLYAANLSTVRPCFPEFATVLVRVKWLN